MKTSVLFLVFNRPNLTSRVFQSIRDARPPRLYVAADGPRQGRPLEAELCEEVRAIATSVDWPCDVHTLFRGENLGCKRAVSGAIDWFFDLEEEGIILEDDCMPVQSFFHFCDELLTKYRDDTRVWHIGGTNPFAPKTVSEESYYFSRYNRIWGWATWRRAWVYNDVDIKFWPEIKNSGFLENTLGKSAAAHYRKLFDEVYSGKIDTWDYQWFLNRLTQGIAIIPTNNLVTNIGFGESATHTKNKGSNFANLPTSQVVFPLVHPSYMWVNEKWDEYWVRKYVLGRSAFSFRLREWLKGLVK